MQVVELVQTAIETSGVTLAWLCERTGIPRTTMTRRLAGHTAFTVAEIGAIADALRVSVDSLTSLAAA